MNNKKLTGILLLAVILMISVGTATAQDGGTPACEGDSVAGTVVSVDAATGLVTIDTGGGVLCAVALAGAISH